MDAQSRLHRILLGEHSFAFLVECDDREEADRFRAACAERRWTARVLDEERPLVEVVLSAVGLRDTARDVAEQRIRAALTAAGVRGRVLASDETAARSGLTVYAPADENFELVQRIWGRAQPSRVVRRPSTVDDLLAVGVFLLAALPFVGMALASLLSPGLSWLIIVVLAAVPWLAAAVLPLGRRARIVCENAGFAALYAVCATLVFAGGVRLVLWLNGFRWSAIAVLIPFCLVLGTVGLRSIGGERLRRGVGWGVPLVLTAGVPLAGDWMAGRYLTAFGLNSTDVRLGTADSVWSGLVVTAFLLFAVVVAVAFAGMVRGVGRVPAVVALAVFAVGFVPVSVLLAAGLAQERGAAVESWFGITPRPVCARAVDPGQALPYEGATPPLDRSVLLLGHAEGRFALWDPETREPSRVPSGAVSLANCG